MREDGGGGVGPEENLAAWMEKTKKTLPAEQALTQRLLGKKKKKKECGVGLQSRQEQKHSAQEYQQNAGRWSV